MMILFFAHEWSLRVGFAPIVKLRLTFLRKVVVTCLDGVRIADTVTSVETYEGTDCLGRGVNEIASTGMDGRHLVDVYAETTTGEWWQWDGSGDVWASTDEISTTIGDDL